MTANTTGCGFDYFTLVVEFRHSTHNTSRIRWKVRPTLLYMRAVYCVWNWKKKACVLKNKISKTFEIHTRIYMNMHFTIYYRSSHNILDKQANFIITVEHSVYYYKKYSLRKIKTHLNSQLNDTPRGIWSNFFDIGLCLLRILIKFTYTLCFYLFLFKIYKLKNFFVSMNKITFQ